MGNNLYHSIKRLLRARTTAASITMLMVFLGGYGCATTDVVSLSFVMPNGEPLTNRNAILVVNHIGISKFPTPSDILRWIGIETFRDPLVLTFCDNESRQLNETGSIQLPQGRIARAIYVFLEEGEASFLYYGWFFPEYPTTIHLFPYNSTSDVRVLKMKEEWAYFLGHILLAESDLLSLEQISCLRRHITPLASESYYEECQYIAPKTLDQRSKECGVEIRK